MTTLQQALPINTHTQLLRQTPKRSASTSEKESAQVGGYERTNTRQNIVRYQSSRTSNHPWGTLSVFE